MQAARAKKKGSVDSDIDNTEQMELNLNNGGNGEENIAQIDPSLLPDLREVLLAGVVVPIPVTDLFIDDALSGRLGGRDAKKYAETKASIQAEGQLEPIGVGLMENGVGILYSGFGRARAIRELMEEGEGDGMILCTLWDKNVIDGYLSGISSNTKREDLNPIQLGGIVNTLLVPPFSMKRKEIATRLGIGIHYISDLLRILTLPDDIQIAIHEGKIGAMAAMQFSKDPERGAAIARKQLAANAEIGRPQISTSEAQVEMRAVIGAGVATSRQIKSMMEELLALNVDPENPVLSEVQVTLLNLLHNFADGYLNPAKVKKVLIGGEPYVLVVKKKKAGPQKGAAKKVKPAKKGGKRGRKKKVAPVESELAVE